MKHDMHYRDCSASEYDDEPPASLGDLLVFAAALLSILLVCMVTL